MWFIKKEQVDCMFGCCEIHQARPLFNEQFYVFIVFSPCKNSNYNFHSNGIFD